MSIQLDSLRKEFPVSEGIEVAVNNISIDIGDEEFFTLVGPSGCGKTTTLRCIAGLETPTSGHIYFDETDVTDIPPNKRQIAMMFQNIALYPHMTVLENIAYPLKIRHEPKEERYEHARKAAEIMEVEDLLNKYPGDISGGQRQRCALARTLVIDPTVFLMDEPLSDLDAELKTRIRKEIQQLHKRLSVPFIYVTHDQEEAMTMSDRIAVMKDGDLEQVGTPKDLYERPANLFVARFIGNPSINFFPGKVTDTSNGTVTVTLGDTDFEFSDVTGLKGGQDVQVGFRPESIHLDQTTKNGEGIDAMVSLLEPLGSTDLVTLDGPEGEVRVTIEKRPDGLKEGDNVRLIPDQTKAYLFDGKSGQFIKKGAS